MTLLDPEAGFLRLLAGLDRLEIRYMVTGSAASSSYGVWRATNDIDVVVDLRQEQVGDFVSEFESSFYIAREQVEQAVRLGRSFNLIHLGSFYKFDLFPLRADRLHQRQFARREWSRIAVFGQNLIEFAVTTAEDSVLSKLAWYKAGGEVSEQQWNDILGIVAQRRDKLDIDYLREWAPHAGVADLLDKALSESHGDARPAHPDSAGK